MNVFSVQHDAVQCLKEIRPGAFIYADDLQVLIEYDFNREYIDAIFYRDVGRPGVQKIEPGKCIMLQGLFPVGIPVVTGDTDYI